MKFTLAWLKEHLDTDAPLKRSVGIMLTVVSPPPFEGEAGSPANRERA
jgi:hypothetical protein